MNEYKSMLEEHSDDVKKDLRSFLESKDFEWSDVISGGVKEVSTTTFRHLLNDIVEGRSKRKMWFRLKSAIAMINYEKNGKWSNLEEEMKNILNSLDLKLEEDFYHNFKLHNEAGSGYFALDFLLPDFRKVIECDGSVWHENVGPEVKEKDNRRDKWLKRLGFETIRFDNDDLRKEDKVRERLKEELFRNEI